MQTQQGFKSMETDATTKHFSGKKKHKKEESILDEKVVGGDAFNMSV